MRASTIPGLAGSAVTTALLLGLLGLTACSGDEPEGSDEATAATGATGSASPSVSTSASPVDAADEDELPPPPPAADTRKAREAFARHVVDAWGWALRHNDPGPFVALSPGRKQPCAGCLELVEELAQRKKEGWYVDFPGAEVRRVRLAPSPTPGTVLATATIDVPASTTYFEDGSVRNTNEEHRGATFELLVRRDGRTFELVGFQLR